MVETSELGMLSVALNVLCNSTKIVLAAPHRAGSYR